MSKTLVRRRIESADEENTMNHHFDTIALAEQHREALLHDARLVRVPRNRSGRRPSMRTLLSRVRHS
jgi:hypothetical protein